MGHVPDLAQFELHLLFLECGLDQVRSHIRVRAEVRSRTLRSNRFALLLLRGLLLDHAFLVVDTTKNPVIEL